MSEHLLVGFVSVHEVIGVFIEKVDGGSLPSARKHFCSNHFRNEFVYNSYHTLVINERISIKTISVKWHIIVTLQTTTAHSI